VRPDTSPSTRSSPEEDGVKVAQDAVLGRINKMSPVPQGTAELIAHIFQPSLPGLF